MRVGLSYRRLSRFRLSAALGLIIIAILLVFYRMESVFITQLECHANNIVTDRVNKAMYNAFEDSGGFEKISATENGSVSSVSADMQKINRMRAKAVIWVQDELNAIASDNVYIPLSSVIGIPVLSGMGLKIPVKVVPMTKVDGEFKESFEGNGINQTLYKLDIGITASVTYCCFNFNKTETITTGIPVISTVINGNVPQYYGLLSGTDANIE